MTTTDMPPAPHTVDRALSWEIRDGIVLIRIDLPGRPVNVLSRAVIDELAETLSWLEREQTSLKGVVIASDKPGVWIAGADVEQLRDVSSAEEAAGMSRMAHVLLGRLEALEIPVVAAIDGVALGGGVELALSCTYRLASDSPKTKLGFPEVQLGLLPGAGGSQRLPRLIGLAQSLDLMLTGKQLDARRALKAGFVDEVVPAAIIVERAFEAVRELASGALSPAAGRPRGSPQWMENLPGARALIFRKARQGVLDKTHGLYPAPLKILEVVEQGIDRPLDEALRIEAEGFGQLAATPESRSLMHVFFTSTAAKNDPELPEGAVAAKVERVAIIGAGFMGAGIATVTAESGMRVRLKDTTDEAAARGLETTRRSIGKRAERRRLRSHQSTEILDRVEATSEYNGFGTIDLVIEAVFEDVGVKHGVIQEVEKVVTPQAIVASNTSTIPIARLAEVATRPERLIGLHFFSPVEKMPLVEIIVTPTTDPSVAATCHAYSKRIGKTPIIVNDAPGFYVNRILGPYMNEATMLLEEGVRIEDIDAAMVGWGFPVGPLTLYDEVGLEVAASSGRILADAFGDRFTPSGVLATLIADDRKGRRNGRGFYRYEDGEKKGPDPSVYELVGSPPPISMTKEAIQERLALGMVNEAVQILEDGVLRSARDGDVGAVFGIGFPPFRGGPFSYIDQNGADRVVARLRALAAAHGDRFAPAPLLARKAMARESFY